MFEFTKRAPAAIAAAFASSRYATLSSIATSNGSMRIGERQTPLGTGGWWIGASVTGLTIAARLALACATACRATRVTSSGVRLLEAAKPQAPPTSTRTPKPKVSLSPMFVTRRSRVPMFCERALEMRASV